MEKACSDGIIGERVDAGLGEDEPLSSCAQ